MSRRRLVWLLSLSLTACGLMWLAEGYVEDLPEGFRMARLRDGYALAEKAARAWSPQAYLESATGIYRREGDRWRIRRGYYIFVDRAQMRYVGITVDLERGRLVVDPPGRVGGKGGLVTTAHLDLMGIPVEDLAALAQALRHLPPHCHVQTAIVRGIGYIDHYYTDQDWYIDFENPRRGFLSRLFLPTIFVNAVTGEVRRSSNWEERDWCPP